VAFKAEELMIQVAPGKPAHPEGTKHCPCEEPSEPPCQESSERHCQAHSKHPCKANTRGGDDICQDDTCLVNRTLAITGTADRAGLDLLRQQMRELLSSGRAEAGICCPP
jgi:hypothetical protein